MSGVELILGDCLDAMGAIADGSVDLVAADLPYAVTACKWDVLIPFEPLWAHYKRIIKPRGAIVLTASQPFTSALVMSNPKWFRHAWVWNKGVAGSFANAKLYPMRIHEDVLVFSPGRCPYSPIKTPRDKAIHKTPAGNQCRSVSARCTRRPEYDWKVYTDRYPTTIIHFSSRAAGARGLHPTQKPVALFEYLIRTYSNDGDLVLDNTMGSGTTGVACINTGRRFIGIEKDPEIFATAQRRVSEAQDARASRLIPA